jgi:hypothetical protein
MTKHALFAMKRPCENCPFLKVGAIPLAPGRVEGIVRDLLTNDYALFHCHKTVHHSVKGGEWREDDDGVERYVPSGKESACVGALIFCLKAGRPPVALRLALMTGDAQYGTLMAQRLNIIDPPNFKEPQ